MIIVAQQPDTSEKPPVVLTQQDFKALLSRHTKNYSSCAQGLKYFCGGEERYTAYPSLPCHTNPRDFFTDLESRTQLNWDETGKLELAKQYCLGSARVLLENVIANHGQDYDLVKEGFLKLFPDNVSPKL